MTRLALAVSISLIIISFTAILHPSSLRVVIAAQIGWTIGKCL